LGLKKPLSRARFLTCVVCVIFATQKENHMGMIYANIELLNAADVEQAARFDIGEDEIRSITVNCLVDTGSVMMAINEEIRAALGLRIKDDRPSQLADGTRLDLPVAGPLEIRFEGRFCTTNAFVLPDDSEPLLGAIPMEEMDLWINPTRQILTFVHPEGPVMKLK
jgi:clan AA aspartic protease